MTLKQFEHVFNQMFNHAEFSCEFDNKKKIDVVWKLIRNCLFRKIHNEPLVLFNLLISIYRSYSDNYKNNDQFIKWLKEVCSKILIIKASEYSTKDRLHNFKLSSINTEVPPDLICVFFMIKHLASIDDIVNSRIELSQDKIDEKFIDAINYCILLRAIKEDEGGSYDKHSI